MIADTGDGQGGGGWGEAEGINLLGVGDCNNDGLFDNFDIDCLEDLYEAEAGPCNQIVGGGMMMEGMDCTYISPEYLAEVMTFLREYFDMP